MAGICAFAPKTRVALGPTPAIWSPIQSGHQVGFCPLGVLESPEGGEENSLFIIRHCDQRRLHSRRLLALACPSRGRELQSPPRSLRPTAPSRIASRKSCRFSVSNVTSLSSRGVRSLTLSSISRVTRSTSPFGARLLEPSMGAGRFLDASRLNGCLAFSSERFLRCSPKISVFSPRTAPGPLRHAWRWAAPAPTPSAWFAQDHDRWLAHAG